MDTCDTDIKISIPDIPVGLSEWTNEAVNQVILESNVIHTMINNLDRNGITVMNVEKHEHHSPESFLAVTLQDGFIIYFSHSIYTKNHFIKITLNTFNNSENYPNQAIFEMDFHCKFNEPLELGNCHKLGISKGYNDFLSLIDLLPEKLKSVATRICDILKDTVNNSEYNITEVNM